MEDETSCSQDETKYKEHRIGRNKENSVCGNAKIF